MNSKISDKKKVAFHTLGCKLNQYETQLLSERLESLGFEIVSEDEIADAYVINSCTVTQIADRKSRAFVRRAKRRNPDAVVALIGCYVEVAREELSEIAEVDLLIGSKDKDALPTRLCELLIEGQGQALAGSMPTAVSGLRNRSRAYVKIEDGCDRFCSYCVIPFARGSVSSKPVEEILDEVRVLIEAGYREFTLTGINIALYGSDFGNPDLPTLLEKIAEIPGDFRIGLGSLEPTVVDETFARRLMAVPKLLPEFHISLQSGSDDILKSMKRPYTVEGFENIVGIIRERYPEAKVSTDIIVGYPGETDEDFEASVRAAGRIGFSHVHVFKYSKRKGTAATEMPNQIPESVKRERSKKLIDIAT